MSLENLFGDLIAVPGVHGAIFFQQKEAPQRFWQEETEWQPPTDKFMRGAGQMIRRLCSSHDRVELRYQRGRLIIQSLGPGLAVGCFTDRDLNLPLLSLTLDELVQTAQSVASEAVPAEAASTVAPTHSAAQIPGTLRPRSEFQSSPEPILPQQAAAVPGAEERPGESSRTSVWTNGRATDAARELPEETFNSTGVEERFSAFSSAVAGDEIISLMPPEASAQADSEEQGGEELVEPLATHASIAAGLSDLSLIATGYLGRSFVVSSWRETQPAAFQPAFQISPDAMVEAENDFAVTAPQTIELAAEWARAFVARCRLVTIDLPLHLVAPLNTDAQALLTTDRGFAERGLILLQYDYLRRLVVDDLQATPPTSQQETAGQVNETLSNRSDESWAG